MRLLKPHTAINGDRLKIKMIQIAAASIILQAAFSFETACFGKNEDGAATLSKISIGSGQFLYVIEADLSAGMLKLTHVESENYPGRKKFNKLAEKSGASAAINGCYFDMNTGRLIGHVYRDGNRNIEGMFEAAFAVGKDNKAVIAPLKELGDKKNYSLIITCVDILIKDKKILIKNKKDLVRNGHDPSKSNDIYKPARWTAIGIDKNGRVYLIVTQNKMTIYKFTKEVQAHTRVTDLLGLDGGASTALYYNGKTLVSPSRPLPSLIALVPEKDGKFIIALR